MSEDTISRQAAIDALDGICDRECEYSKKQRAVMCAACHLGSAFDAMDKLPSAERRGRWEFNIDDEGWSWDYPYMCDQCGEWAEKEFKFCPSCGARMEEEYERT